MIKLDLAGKKFGLLTVTKEVGRKNRSVLWECKCDCGNTVFKISSALNNNKMRFCSDCRKKLTPPTNFTHNMSKTRIYKIWSDVVRRTTKKTHLNYKNYGAKGIGICERWLKFENFYQDMNKTYSDELEIDRIDNSKGYSEENCRWTTRSVNMHNTNCRKNKTSNYKGVSFDKFSKKWVSVCSRDGKTLYKRTKTELEAAKTYNEFAIKLYGEFASLNDV